MSQYYEPSQWPPSGQAGWEHQTPPPARSGANSAIPREESAAFSHQFEEVDRAVENLVKSGKMFAGGPQGGGRHGRMSAGPGSRPHSSTDFGDARGPHQSNLQNFYATQRHQSSRGSNEAEQMIQAKRRMAAQRERELRNYHQEQQFNRTVLAEQQPYGPKPDRALSPGNMSEEDRRKLIAQQRSALYGEGSFSEAPGYVDETGTPRPGLPAPHGGPVGMRHSPRAFEYGRPPPAHPEAPQQGLAEGAQGSQAPPNEQSRTNSNSSPQSNPAGNKGVFDAPQQSSRTSASSPGGSPPRQGASKPAQSSVAPIGTRPSISNSSGNPGPNKRSSPPLLSPLNPGYAAHSNDDGAQSAGASQNQPSSAIEGQSVGLSGWGGRPGGWGNKSGLGAQASVSSVWG
ncbi:hypothetical protein QBC34DRAFT_140187 [Podospora aff. communis PSN243]|uniref:Uncharacterized protein n=1 Tax=Podospora aff. communis PSN243 TaxID=3040156 RepID=A0AAV9H1U6_9PEZI|nr:hypothetical protein QBC34DRAFT_140187 [Podospora aff. communis PSN243]